MTAKESFWDRQAEGYAKRPIRDEASYQKKLEITRTYFRPDMSVMEFGCGTGSTAILHAPHVKHIDAYDVSEKMIEIAKAKAAAANISNITFRAAAIGDINPPAGSYDAVLGLNILHLLKDPAATIRRVKDMLRPGGYFISSTPCFGVGRLWFLRLMIPPARVLGYAPLLRFLTPNGLRKSITDAGFTIDQEWSHAKGIVLFVVAKKPA